MTGGGRHIRWVSALIAAMVTVAPAAASEPEAPPPEKVTLTGQDRTPPVVRLTVPAARHAFSPEIIDRMRAGLVALQSPPVETGTEPAAAAPAGH